MVPFLLDDELRRDAPASPCCRRCSRRRCSRRSARWSRPCGAGRWPWGWSARTCAGCSGACCSPSILRLAAVAEADVLERDRRLLDRGRRRGRSRPSRPGGPRDDHCGGDEDGDGDGHQAHCTDVLHAAEYSTRGAGGPPGARCRRSRRLGRRRARHAGRLSTKIRSSATDRACLEAGLDAHGGWSLMSPKTSGTSLPLGSPVARGASAGRPACRCQQTRDDRKEKGHVTDRRSGSGERRPPGAARPQRTAASRARPSWPSARPSSARRSSRTPARRESTMRRAPCASGRCWSRRAPASRRGGDFGPGAGSQPEPTRPAARNSSGSIENV